MKLSRRGLLRGALAFAGGLVASRVAGKSEDRSEPSPAPGVDLAAGKGPTWSRESIFVIDTGSTSTTETNYVLTPDQYGHLHARLDFSETS